MNKLILWDIDGTLIHGGGVAGEAIRAAMTRVYGPAEGAERISYAGKTDMQIIMETFAERDGPELLGRLEQFTAIYEGELADRREAFLARGYVLPGVVSILERLAEADVIQTLLTGNLKSTARIKLEMFDLARFFDLELGAYGGDHHHRPELVPFALRRAEQRYGRRYAGAEIVVIGDTPNDVACGKAGGARTIAVATGGYSAEALRHTGADVVLESLEDADTLAAILG